MSKWTSRPCYPFFPSSDSTCPGPGGEGSWCVAHILTSAWPACWSPEQSGHSFQLFSRAEQRPPCAALAQVHWLWCSKTAEELPPGRWFSGHLLLPRKKFEHSLPELEPFLCSPLPVSFTSVAPVLLIRKGIGVGWMCRPFLSLLQASQVYMACVPCPGEEMDHSHALWTSLLTSHGGASVDYSGTTPCLQLSGAKPLP